MSLIKKGIAEAIGTFVLVFCACGTAAWTGGSGYLSPASTALAFGLVIVAMAYSIGRISGCHINPAVSLGCLLTKRMSLKEFFVYVGAQLVGGIVGAIALFGIIKMGNVEVMGDACNNILGYGMTKTYNLNGTVTTTSNLADLGAGNYIGAILIEVILTFIFVYVILNVTDAKNEGIGKKAGIVIGLTLTLVHLIGIGFTGTSVNPARSIATAIGTAIFNGNLDPLKEIWVFIIAPLGGGALAALVFNLLHKEKEAA